MASVDAMTDVLSFYFPTIRFATYTDKDVRRRFGLNRLATLFSDGSTLFSDGRRLVKIDIRRCPSDVAFRLFSDDKRRA